MGSEVHSLERLPANEVDAAALVELMNDAYLRYEILQAPRIDISGFHDELQPDSEFLLARDGGSIAACAMVCGANGYFAATAGVTSNKPEWLEGSERAAFEHDGPVGVPFEGDLSDALYFGLAAVRRNVQNGGLGRRLVEEAERIARERGARRVVLTTLREFGLPAYYERLGYRLVGVDEHPAGHWSITVAHGYCYMEKVLLGAVIREARQSDAQVVAALVNLAYEVEDFFKVGDRTDAAEVARIIERDRFFVAEEGGVLVGCAYLRISDGRGHFGMLSVHPEAQGRGIARALIEHLEALCAERGCSYLDLEYVNLREELPAFYRRLGFEVTGETPWPEDALHRISRPAHFVTMSKPVSPRERTNRR